VREVLMTMAANLTAEGMVREVLLVSAPPPLGGNVAVSINTG
jgi:hypothetical protein